MDNLSPHSNSDSSLPLDRVAEEARLESIAADVSDIFEAASAIEDSIFGSEPQNTERFSKTLYLAKRNGKTTLIEEEYDVDKHEYYERFLARLMAYDTAQPIRMSVDRLTRERTVTFYDQIDLNDPDTPRCSQLYTDGSFIAFTEPSIVPSADRVSTEIVDENGPTITLADQYVEREYSIATLRPGDTDRVNTAQGILAEALEVVEGYEDVISDYIATPRALLQDFALVPYEPEPVEKYWHN